MQPVRTYLRHPCACCSSAVLWSTGLFGLGWAAQASYHLRELYPIACHQPGKTGLDPKFSASSDCASCSHVAAIAALKPLCFPHQFSAHVQLRDGGHRISSLLSALRLRTLSPKDVVHMLVAAYTTTVQAAVPDPSVQQPHQKLAAVSLAQHLDHLQFLGSHFASASDADRALVPSLKLQCWAALKGSPAAAACM